MRIAIASGKGGTGKTTVATSLVVSLARGGETISYLDCDVEEPNGHVFLKPEIRSARDVTLPVPEVDQTRCDSCGACSRACRYAAIIALPKLVLTFPKLCHGCGGCGLACPLGAIREVPRVIGQVEEGFSGAVRFLQGRMEVGEAMAPPLIRSLLASAPETGTLVFDAPPGTSCPVIESVKSADVVLLVTEPTPFGLHDLDLAVQMVRQLGLPFGVAINRAGIGDRQVYSYCSREGIPILLEIPNDRAIAEGYSRGELLVDGWPRLEEAFFNLYTKLSELANGSPREPSIRELGERFDGGTDQPPSDELEPGQDQALPELVVVSGKGGTGKTSIVAALSALSEQVAIADCDVDAADLHLVLNPEVRKRWSFSGGLRAEIDSSVCSSCGYCVDVCRFEAIAPLESEGRSVYRVDGVSCEGCGVCADNCPEEAIKMLPSINGEWFLSDTRFGPMVHARLGIAEENSGKLVSLLRKEGRAMALTGQREILLCDGSPGIGCPVIASIVGARVVLIVSEPTLSGLHDMKRVAELCRQFEVQAGICINKFDVNLQICEQIEEEARRRGIELLGRIRYDESVTEAQCARTSVVEAGDGAAADDIRALWGELTRIVHQLRSERTETPQ